MYIALTGTAAQGSGSGPLGLSLDETFIELSIPTEESQTSASGEIVVTATATGGTPPYEYAWSVFRFEDPSSAFTHNIGTTDEAMWGDATITTSYQGPPNFEVDPPTNLPPDPASYTMVCVVTDDNGDTAGATMDLSVTAE